MRTFSVRAVLVLGLCCAGFLVHAQDMSKVSTAISDFSKSVAPALPASATASLSWSDAFIGELIAVPPHFGIGVSAQAIFLPMKGVDSLLTALGQTKPSALSGMDATGVPLPSYSIEARIGGLFLPFDIGLKGGFIPGDVKNMTGDFAVDYLMLGGDLRIAILKDEALSPGLSIGLGYTYLKGGLYYKMSDISIATVPTGVGTTSTVALSKPKVGFEWEDSTIDLKLQLSKNLVIITPYIGTGLNLSWAQVGGGFYATPTIGGTAMTEAQMSYLKSNFPGNPALVNVSADGISAKYRQDAIFGWRMFGGLSLNLTVIRLDLSALYNFTSSTFGANVGLRFQL